MRWNDDIQYLKGVGPKRAALFAKLGIHTVGELLVFYPRSYIDYSKPVPVAEAPYDEPTVVKVEVLEKEPGRRISGGRTLHRVMCSDGTAPLGLVFFNNPYVPDKLEVGKEYLFYGRVGGGFTGREMIAPQFLPLDAPARLTPVYPLTEGLSSRVVAACMSHALSAADEAPEPLPAELLEEYKMVGKAEAIRAIHQPHSQKEAEQAKRRLVFEELFCLQLGLLSLRGREVRQTGAPMEKADLAPFYGSLPFSLTGAQKRAIEEIENDMQAAAPMNRLLQGDVGSGKTLVAAAAILMAAQNGYQSVLMAPTEILAGQHGETLDKTLAPLGLRTALLTGGVKGKARKGALAAIEAGDADVIVGTHAVLSEPVTFYNLGLAITDEQHRFGVRQRGLLAGKANQPHLLVMSATPIPRTLALLMFGDLDISVLDEMPPGRQPVKTFVVPVEKRRDMYGFLNREIQTGRQVYIVCPLIEEGESDLQAATTYAQEVAVPLLPGAKVGLMHGRLKPAEKAEVMRAFRQGEMDALVSTTVIEVGVDVPNASVMVIEDAERYGLSALHQLRGRVGRGADKSYCFLLSGHTGQAAQQRLQFLTQSNDGFEVAKYDLDTRGPGDFFGSRQHGLPTLHVADLATDTRVLKVAQQAAVELYRQDPGLQKPEYKHLARAVNELFAGNTAMN